MDLAFETKPLRTLCEREDEAARQLGADVAEVLKHRLADFRAAVSIKDVVPGNPRLVESDSSGQTMVIDLLGGYTMIFCANHPRSPLLESGLTDWSKVSRIRIVEIGRQHGDQ